MERDEDDEDIPPPVAELDGPRSYEPARVITPREVRPWAGSLWTHLLAAAAGVLIGACIVVVLVVLVNYTDTFESAEPELEQAAPGPPPLEPRPLAPRGLKSLDGGAVAFVPSGRVHVVNVWLEGCADCMPSFEAWRALVEEERLPSGVPISNVAYVRASDGFASRYRVSEGLVIDDGSNVVKPLGITRFTTLVVDPGGKVCHRDDPVVSGYVERLSAALARCAETHAQRGAR